MSKDMTTSRRNFLTSGAIVAAPLAFTAVPAAAAALTDDGSKVRLARIEDERAIEALNRIYLRRFNAGAHTGDLFASGKMPKLAEGLIGLSLDAAAETEHFALSENGDRASARFACTAEFDHALEGKGTFIEMARLQGNGSTRLSEARSFVGNYVRTAEGWAIERIELS